MRQTSYSAGSSTVWGTWFWSDRSAERAFCVKMCCRHSTRITAHLNAAAPPPARHWQPCLTNFVELCATKDGAIWATRAGGSKSRLSTESGAASARRVTHPGDVRFCGKSGTLGKFAQHQSTAAHVAYGSSADIAAALANVRFTPESRHGAIVISALCLMTKPLPSSHGSARWIGSTSI